MWSLVDVVMEAVDVFRRLDLQVLSHLIVSRGQLNEPLATNGQVGVHVKVNVRISLGNLPPNLNMTSRKGNHNDNLNHRNVTTLLWVRSEYLCWRLTCSSKTARRSSANKGTHDDAVL